MRGSDEESREGCAKSVPAHIRNGLSMTYLVRGCHAGKTVIEFSVQAFLLEPPMISIPSFDQLLDAISQLPPEEQADLVDVVRRRLSELRRREIIAEVLEAEGELQRGSSGPRAACDVIRDITS
ncbi:MAG: hypothetical protein ACKOBP_10320 [Planctomycetia bacterium]